MEFGPRALGNRSILGDPRRSDMQEKLNLKIKFRESFRPFAPAVMEERVGDCFELQTPSPYMLLVAPVKEALRLNDCSRRPVGGAGSDFAATLKQRRSTLPAVTHVDYSARVQTVSAGTNPRFYDLLDAFEQRTGCPVLVNTSFNIRGEPPVCTPEEAYRCFLKTEMDHLVLGNFLIEKEPRLRERPLLEAVSPNENSSVPSLRRFGFTLTAMFALLGTLFTWRHRMAGRPLTALALLFLLVSIFGPSLLRFVHRPWMILAHLLGSIASKIILTLAFFLVVTPIGLLQRLFGKQPLDLRFKDNEPSYWRARSGNPAAADYEKQF